MSNTPGHNLEESLRYVHNNNKQKLNRKDYSPSATTPKDRKGAIDHHLQRSN